MKTTGHLQCECQDPGCQCLGMCEEISEDCTRLYRIDMDDSEGVVMCGACGDEALDSGVFDELPTSEHEEYTGRPGRRARTINWPWPHAKLAYRRALRYHRRNRLFHGRVMAGTI